jgi:hypothetical protein
MDKEPDLAESASLRPRTDVLTNTRCPGVKLIGTVCIYFKRLLPLGHDDASINMSLSRIVSGKEVKRDFPDLSINN